MRRRFLSPLFILTAVVAIPVTANTLVVAKVSSGNLIEFEGGFAVHLAGISVPGPDTPIGRQAHAVVKQRIEGKRVAVFTWTTDNTAAGIVHGEDGLAFATIVYGRGLSEKGSGTDIAAELLELGYARVDPEHLPDGYEHYRDIERRAKQQNLGIWAP
jgi:endonuclease YncB( thermonuclease family)